jgi:hypothetical protein
MTSPHAQHEPLTMRQNGKRPRDFDMDEGLQQRKRSRNDVSDLLLCSSTYLTTLSSSLQSRYCHHRLPDMLPLIAVMWVALSPWLMSPSLSTTFVLPPSTPGRSL